MTLFSVIWNVFSIKVSTILSLSTLPMWDRQFRQKRSTLNWYLDGVAGRLCGSITWLERQNRRLVEAQLNSIYVSSQIINFCFRTVPPRFRKLKLNVWLNFTQNATKQFLCTITCLPLLDPVYFFVNFSAKCPLSNWNVYGLPPTLSLSLSLSLSLE